MNQYDLEHKINDLEQKYWNLYSEVQEATRKSRNASADALEAKTEAENDEFLDPVPEYFPFEDIPSCTHNNSTFGANPAERDQRKKAYNKAVQEQLEEESMQEGKIGQRCIDPKRSLEYRAAAMYIQTYKEIKNLPESLLGEPPYFSGEEI